MGMGLILRRSHTDMWWSLPHVTNLWPATGFAEMQVTLSFLCTLCTLASPPPFLGSTTRSKPKLSPAKITPSRFFSTEYKHFHVFWSYSCPGFSSKLCHGCAPGVSQQGVHKAAQHAAACLPSHLRALLCVEIGAEHDTVYGA